MDKRPTGLSPSKCPQNSLKLNRGIISDEQEPSSSSTSGYTGLDTLSESCVGDSQEQNGAKEWWRPKLHRASSVWPSLRHTESSGSISFGFKNKITSIWNSIKYSGTWMHFSDGNYSSEGAQIIVLLGQFYYPEGDDNVNGTSFLDFCRDYYSRIWMTYRTGMPAFLGSVITSDCGWGCMIRTTQMALAQAIVVNQMTREWRFKKPSSMNEFRQQARSDPYASTQVEILRLFEDCHSAPLGIHKILEISKANNSVTNPIGRWYAPSEVLSLVRKALNLSVSPLTSDLSMLLALDGQVFIGDIERECLSWSKRLLLFVPLRLGTVCVNSSVVFFPNIELINLQLYNYHVRQLLSLKTCLGILGGKPHHSLYFIGCFGDDMIYLDPHVAQEYVPISTWDEDLAVNKDKNGKVRKHPLTTFHCRLFSKIAMKEMDPSCVVGFIFKSREELDESFRILNLNHVVDVDTGPEKIARRCKDPLFSVHYEEVTNNYSHYSVTDEERQNALEHGFEML